MEFNYGAHFLFEDKFDLPDDFSAEETDLITHLVPVDEKDIPDNAFSKDPIAFTDQLVSKIDRYAEKQGKVFASKFKRFTAAVQNTDFSKTDPNSLYEVRDMITHLAERYGLLWIQFDTCYDAWLCERIYKLDQKHYTKHCYGFAINYSDSPRSELSRLIPQFVLQKYGVCSADEIKAGIKDDIINCIKNGYYWC